MSNLVRKDNPDVRIVGTFERVHGVAAIAEASMSDGTLNITYGGGTSMNWDGQETVPDAQGGRTFIDENGDEVPESKVQIAEGSPS